MMTDESIPEAVYKMRRLLVRLCGRFLAHTPAGCMMVGRGFPSFLTREERYILRHSIILSQVKFRDT